ncbi:4'-phosphopantetheinyl transferase [Vibrio agarivorans]|nr:4'-phosphopantetheinyl transferase [Vibrio agarivorans]
MTFRDNILEKNNFDHIFSTLNQNLNQLKTGICLVKATTEMYQQLGFSQEEVLIANAVPKRQHEFRAGRHAARAAMRTLRPNYIDAPILIGSNREPLFPKNISGSISHTEELCLAACADKYHIASLGIDIERRVPLAEELKSVVYTHLEQQVLNQDTHLPSALIFSIKESVFKCFYPFVQVYFDFLDAQISLQPDDNTSGQFTVELIGANRDSLLAKLPPLEFQGHYIFNQDYVFSLCFFIQSSCPDTPICT